MNGGNSCSGTRGCPPSCCPRGGRAAGRQRCAIPNQPGCSPLLPASWTAACGPGDDSVVRARRGSQLLVSPHDVLFHLNEGAQPHPLVASVGRPPRGSAGMTPNGQVTADGQHRHGGAWLVGPDQATGAGAACPPPLAVVSPPAQ